VGNVIAPNEHFPAPRIPDAALPRGVSQGLSIRDMQLTNGSVLVTDGNQRSTLAVVRTLGKRGVQVIVAAETERSLAGASRYCNRAVIYPSPYQDEEGFIICLLETSRRLGVNALFPMTDIAMHHVLAHRKDFEEIVALPIPSSAAFEVVSNKYTLMQLARQLRVPIATTAFVPNGLIQEQLACIETYPVVVKPAKSVIWQERRWWPTSVHYATNETELLRLYQKISYLSEPSLIQQRIDGPGIGIFALMDRGEPVALFAHRRLREKPPSGGVSVLRESIPLPQPATEYALCLLRHVGWHGVAMVEFKVDRDKNTPILMEINGRFWGSLQLAIDAGVNFPFLLYSLALGTSMERVYGYSMGTRLRWLLGDLDHLLLRLLKAPEELNLPPGYPSKLRTLVEFCRSFDRRTRYEILRLEDPKPFILELCRYFGGFRPPPEGSKQWTQS